MKLHLTHASRWALPAIIALALGLLAACGGDEGSTTLTEAEAQTVADAGLLQLDDLPTGEWEQENDLASIGELLPADTDLGSDIDVPEVCQAFADAMSDLPATLGDVEPIATSGRSFSIIGETLSAQVISSTVLVFAESEDASAASGALQAAFDTDAIEACLLSALGPISEAGIEVDEFRVDRPDYALDDSTGLRISVDAVAFILPIELGVDLHIFDRGNALAMYLALELNADDLEAFHGGLLETFAGRVEAAQ
jgi:hypothetical protein